MCMIYDDDGNVLVQDRRDSDWGGITFPGGHVEKGESFTDEVIREVYEETGLTIETPQICGIKQWPEAVSYTHLLPATGSAEYSPYANSTVDAYMDEALKASELEAVSYTHLNTAYTCGYVQKQYF